MQILKVQLYSTMNYLSASDSGIMVNFGNVISSVSNYTFLSLSIKITLPPAPLYTHVLLNEFSLYVSCWADFSSFKLFLLYLICIHSWIICSPHTIMLSLFFFFLFFWLSEKELRTVRKQQFQQRYPTESWQWLEFLESFPYPPWTECSINTKYFRWP